MKPLLLIAGLIFASTAAQAEAQPFSTDLYECTPVYESAGARTVDQVDKTNIAVTRNKESRPIGMSVQHILVSGAVRTRNDQYTTRFETDGGQFFRWSGSLNGNQRITMSGSLDRDPRSNSWMYSERQWDERHLEWSARSACHHVVSNATAATLPDHATAATMPAQTENNSPSAKNAEAELAHHPWDWYILSWTFDPRRLWASFPILAVVWLTSRSSKKPWRKALAKSLQPWLVGMLTAEAIFFAAKLWLPQSQYDNFSWIDSQMLEIEGKLEKVFPFPLLINLLLLAAIFALNMWYPQLRAWTRRFEKGVELGKSSVSVLAVFTSVTFFGTGAVAAVHYERLKDQATAKAQLMLAARVTENRKTEAEDVKSFLDVVHRIVSADIRIGDSRPLKQMVREDAQEVLKYEPTLVRDAATAIDNSKLNAMLNKTLTDDQLKDAKDGFNKALELLVGKGAEITSHPLLKTLRSAGLPEEATSIVEALYEAALSRLSRAIVDPLADATFRPRSSEASLAPDALKRAWQRPVFDEKELPPRIANPTDDVRLAELKNRNRMILENNLEKTVESVRETVRVP